MKSARTILLEIAQGIERPRRRPVRLDVESFYFGMHKAISEALERLADEEGVGGYDEGE